MGFTGATAEGHVVYVVSSVEVAPMVDKDHKHLMRDIKGYKGILDISSTLSTSSFFLESTYLDNYNLQSV